MKYIKTIDAFAKVSNESLLSFLSNSGTKINNTRTKSKIIKGNLDLEYSLIDKLQDNLIVYGDLILYRCVNLYKLPNNLTVKDDLIISGSSVLDIPNNLKVGGDFIINNTPILDKMNIMEIKSLILERGGEIKGSVKVYAINEGIDSKLLNPVQKEAYEELKTSNVELFDDRDYEHYANKIGVNIEDVIEFVAHNNIATNDTEDDYIENMLRYRIQSDIIDNPDVDNVNLMIRLEELADVLYMEGDIDIDYEEIYNKLKYIHKEMTNNQSQMEFKFESKINKINMKIKKFNENWDQVEKLEENEEEIIKVSDILNETGVYDKIGDALNIEIDTDSVIFREIEEFIVTMYKEMQDNNSK